MLRSGLFQPRYQSWERETSRFRLIESENALLFSLGTSRYTCLVEKPREWLFPYMGFVGMRGLNGLFFFRQLPFINYVNGNCANRNGHK